MTGEALDLIGAKIERANQSKREGRRAMFRRHFGSAEGLRVLTVIGDMVALAREDIPLDAAGRLDADHKLVLVGKRALLLEILELAGVEISLVASSGEGRLPQEKEALT